MIDSAECSMRLLVESADFCLLNFFGADDCRNTNQMSVPVVWEGLSGMPREKRSEEDTEARS